MQKYSSVKPGVCTAKNDGKAWFKLDRAAKPACSVVTTLSRGAPEAAVGLGDESVWPDKDHGLACGQCLMDQFENR